MNETTKETVPGARKTTKRTRKTAPNKKTTEAKTVSDTVIVAYNDPSSIIFEVKANDGTNEKVLINGNATDLRGKEMGVLPIGKYGMTVVKREIWEKIQAKYGKMPAFRTGRIFASSDKASADAEAAEKKNLRSGKEPVDPEKAASTTTAPDTTNM